MGVDTSVAKFLLAGKAAGVDFARLATIGRQNMMCDRVAMRAFFSLIESANGADAMFAGPEGCTQALWRMLGADAVSIVDASDFEGANVVHDMNEPIPPDLRGRYSAVFDGGCVEHIFNVPQVVRNMMQMVEVGGHFLGVTSGNNLCGHGFYQFSPEWAYRVFSADNGYEARAVLLCEIDNQRPRFYAVYDPATSRRRAELWNDRPTYIMILARRIAEAEIFSRWPQQSDYAALWAEHDQQKSSPATDGAECGDGGPPVDRSGGAGGAVASAARKTDLLAPLRWDGALRTGLRRRRQAVRVWLRTRDDRRALARHRRTHRSLSWFSSAGFDAECYHRLTDAQLAAGRLRPGGAEPARH